MLLLSKANLAPAAVASRDKREPALCRLHVAEDGSTVAANHTSVMAVGPPCPERTRGFPDVEEAGAEPPEGGVGVPLDLVADARRNLPADKRASLQYVKMTRCDEREVELMTTDGQKRRKVAAAPLRGRFPRWRGILAEARRKATVTRACFNRQDLIKLLQAIDDACPDRGQVYNPVYLEIGEEGDAMVLRAENVETRQMAIGMIKPLDTGGAWLEGDRWERGVCEVEAKAKKTVKRGRKEGSDR